jgi:flagellar M-ring protein FliF
MVDFIRGLWARSSFGGRALLVGGVVLAVAVPAALFWWLERPDYQVLFADMDAKDAAAVVATLEKQKTPYAIADDGKTILVDKESLYKTRMKLMGSGLDLKGTVGLELFNNAEFGMTEFAQKINFQRALQGELERTIMGFDEVQGARVHLVLPEGGLLRKRGAKAKASVWVTLKGGKSLAQEQVSGIQRLVAASVPEMEAEAVTVLDQRGIALSARARGEDGLSAGDADLQLKKETEVYLASKVAHILDTALGPNQAAVGVDVTMDFSAVRTTRESVLGGSAPATGVLVRRHEQWHGNDEPAVAANSVNVPASPVAASGANKLEDEEYQVGREVQQTVLGSGRVKHISVGIVTNTSLSDSTVERLRGVIAMTIGLDGNRGDGIAFSTMDNIQNVAQPAGPMPPSAARPSPVNKFILLSAAGALLALLAICALWLLRRPQHKPGSSLTDSEREQVLQQVKRWLAEEHAAEESVP